MTGNRAQPDLTLVTLIHQSLRADAARLAAIEALDPGGRPARLPGIRAFFDHYRAQLVLHHTHEDTVFFPALQARVGAGRMHLDALADQHEALDSALQAVSGRLAALADPAGDFPADRASAAGAVSAIGEQLAAHLALEEQTALPLFESQVPAADYKKLEATARKATPRPQAQFMIPWLIAHATPGQQKALFRSAPALRLFYWLHRRRYRHLEQRSPAPPCKPRGNSSHTTRPGSPPVLRSGSCDRILVHAGKPAGGPGNGGSGAGLG